MSMLLSMRPANNLPLRGRVLPLFVGARHEIAAEAKPSARSRFPVATRHLAAATRLAQPQQQHAGVRRRGRASVAPDGLVAFAPHSGRKRPLSWRLLNMGTSSEDAGRGSISTGGRSSSSSSSDSTASCWNCGSTVNRREYFCECGAAQPLDGRLDYFEMFGCPPSVFLELKEVEKRFKNMQRAFHPDLFAGKCESEREISAANSAAANKAYQTLVQPMARVKYLMRLLGSTALEEEGADDRTPVPMDFLMEVMETRGSLEQCSSPDEVEAILAETRNSVDECLRDMDEALKAGGGKDEISDAAVRLRYLYRIEDEARRVLHGLEDGHANPNAG